MLSNEPARIAEIRERLQSVFGILKLELYLHPLLELNWPRKCDLIGDK